jgi:lipid-A-disaccharide synthase
VSGERNLFVFVGDLSADKHVSKVLSKLKEDAPDLSVWGVGGSEMEAAGAEILYNLQTFSTFGIVEVIRVLPLLQKIKKHILAEIAKRRPQAILLVDFGGFNIHLAQTIRKHYSKEQLPIIYFISPQVWASRPWRINALKATINKMLVIFPFEEKIYRDQGIESYFVGNPYTTNLPKATDLETREAFAAKHGLDPNRPIIGIFPGSRKQEIRDHIPVVLQAVAWVLQERPEVQCVISKANATLDDLIEKLVDKLGYRHLVGDRLKLISPGENYNLMTNCDLAWAKSGSTTLEAAMLGTPMLIFYRSNWISAILIFFFKQIKRVGWPNILAGEGVVPELFQLDCRAEQFVRYTCDWLDVPAFREQTTKRLQSVKAQLGRGEFVSNVSKQILATLGITAKGNEKVSQKLDYSPVTKAST